MTLIMSEVSRVFTSNTTSDNHFRDEPFQAINCTGTDNTYAPEMQEANIRTCPSYDK